MQQPKYKVGDILKLKHMLHKDYKFHVIEAITQTCPGGTQVHYIGRGFVKDFGLRSYTKSMWHPTKDLCKYNESEIEGLWLEEEDKKDE